MTLQRLYSYVRRTIDTYGMIASGDRIGIGISGGKDSLTLLYALAGLRRFYPLPYSIVAVTVDLGYEGFCTDAIRRLCESLSVDYYVVPTQIKDAVLDCTDSPCALCAHLRKGALNSKLLELGCNKIAYAHNMEDVIETMILSLIFEGRFHTFSPVTYLDKTGLTLIRPMMEIPEAEILGFMHEFNLPVEKNPCPYDGNTKREYARQLLRQLNIDHPGVKKRLYHAITDSSITGWDKKITNGKREYTNE